jgi:cell division protease FtsH
VDALLRPALHRPAIIVTERTWECPLSPEHAPAELLVASGVFGHDHGQPFLGRELSCEPNYSDEIDDEIRRIVEEADQTARRVLEDHREQLGMVSDILLRRETIEREQFIELLDGKTEEEVFDVEEPHVPVPPPAAPEAPERKPERRRSRCPGRGGRRRRSNGL